MLIAGRQAHPALGWFVQVSDLHISKFTDNPIVPDLISLSKHVLHPLRPDKILLTGDLVDAKTKHGASQQWEEEWVAYKQLWRDMAAAAGVPVGSILDIRGNHDTFDTIRGGYNDYFSTHSTRAPGSRCVLHPDGTVVQLSAACCHHNIQQANTQLAMLRLTCLACTLSITLS